MLLLKKKPKFGLIWKKWMWCPLIVFTALYGLLFASCGAIKEVPVETNVETHYIDSIRWEIRDSIRIKEETRYKEWAGLLDTLRISSARGTQMRAWNDTTLGVLSGELREPELKEQTRIIYKDRWKTKDSLVFKEVPIEVEKPVRYIPRWVWWSLAFNILTILGIGLIIYLKIKKPIG